MAQNLRAVNPYPVERRVRKNVDIVPAELLREEIIHACAADDLRQRACEAETVREPRDGAPLPEAGLEISLSEDELARQCLTRWHIGIVLNPRPADRVKLSRQHLLAHAFEKRWV